MLLRAEAGVTSLSLSVSHCMCVCVSTMCNDVHTNLYIIVCQFDVSSRPVTAGGDGSTPRCGAQVCREDKFIIVSLSEVNKTTPPPPLPPLFCYGMSDIPPNP